VQQRIKERRNNSLFFILTTEYKELLRVECKLSVSGVVYSLHSSLSNSLYFAILIDSLYFAILIDSLYLTISI